MLLYKYGEKVRLSMKILRIILKVVGQLLFLFGLLGWIYGVMFQFIYPEWLTTTLSHLTRWIRVDSFAVLSFALSALGFLLWRFMVETSPE